MSSTNSPQEQAELEKIVLDIRQLRQTMYLPWLTTLLTIASMVVGWYQFNQSLDSALKQQQQDIKIQLQRDTQSRQHEFQKYFLEKRTVDYVAAVQTAAAIAQWPKDSTERNKLKSKFKMLHDGTMKLYEDKNVLTKMSKFLSKLPNVEDEQKSPKPKSRKLLNDLLTDVTFLAEACRASLENGTGLSQPAQPVSK